MRDTDKIKLTDLSLFPNTFWSESLVQMALEDVDTQSLSPAQRQQFEKQLSANILLLHYIRRAREAAQAEGHKKAQTEGIRRALAQGKLTPAEIANLFQVPLAVVEALQ